MTASEFKYQKGIKKMEVITIYENGQIILGSDSYHITSGRNLRITPSQGFITLYKNGEVYLTVTESELEKSGVVISNIQDFKSILEITLNDNWGRSQYQFNLKDALVHNLYVDWANGGERA